VKPKMLHTILIYWTTIPKEIGKKSTCKNGCRKRNIQFHPLETLPELYQKVKAIISREKQYELDQIAMQKGHRVIRLPPYHCQYNQIELIWAQV